MFDLVVASEPLDTRYGRMLIPEGDSVIGRSLKLYGEWAQHEIDALLDLVEDDGIILDVGANIGTHSLAFAKRRPNSLVVAFEPQPVPFQILSANALLNGCRNIRALNIGCGDADAIAWVNCDYDALDRNVGAFSIERFRLSGPETAGFPLRLLPIDVLSFAAPVRLIKMDVEGMESTVLAGTCETIKTHRPVVYLEMLDIAASTRCYSTLQNLSYDLYWLETWAYNANNFNNSAENVWSRCELGILALPSECGHLLDLPRVRGDETELPSWLDPYGGYRAAQVASMEPLATDEVPEPPPGAAEDPKISTMESVLNVEGGL